MSDLEATSFNPFLGDPEVVVERARKAQRAGVPRAAREDSIAARLDEIKRDAAARWQETRAA